MLCLLRQDVELPSSFICIEFLKMHLKNQIVNLCVVGWQNVESSFFDELNMHKIPNYGSLEEDLLFLDSYRQERPFPRLVPLIPDT